MLKTPPLNYRALRAFKAPLPCLLFLSTSLLGTPVSATDNWDLQTLTSKEYQVGGIVVVQPKYEGGKSYRVYGFPYLLPDGVSKSQVVQFRGSEDIRFRLFEYQGFELGPVAGWRFDRDESDGSLLQGLGDVQGGLVLGLYTGYRFGPFFPFVSYRHQVTGDDTGGVLKFGAEFKVPVTSYFSYTLLAGANYADSDYMNSYFSITPDQSFNTGFRLPTYSAEPGIKDFFIGLVSDVPLTRDWTMKVSGNYARLVGDAAASPVVENVNQFYGGVGLTYRFSFHP